VSIVPYFSAEAREAAERQMQAFIKSVPVRRDLGWLREFFTFVLLQSVTYFLLVVNFRAVAQARFFWTLVSDTTIAALNFWMIQKVAGAKSRAARAGYIVGGAAGSMLGLVVTKILYGG
jgi:hypothetical protein